MRILAFISLYLLIIISCETTKTETVVVTETDTLIVKDTVYVPVDGPRYTYKWERMSNTPQGVLDFGKNDDIYFIDENTGWAMASFNYSTNEGSIYRTVNGGVSWIRQFSTQAYFRSIGFFDANVGFAGNLRGAEYGASLYMTQDGGFNWTHLNNLDSLGVDGICGIAIADNNTMYASGRYDGEAKIVKTADRGATWQVFDISSQANMLVDIHFWSADSGVVVGGIGRVGSDLTAAKTVVLTTFNGGLTWEERYRSTRTTEWGWKISFLDRKKGFVSIQSFRGYYGGTSYSTEFFLKTSDGGLTWSEHSFVSPLGGLYSSQAIGFISEDIGWMGSWITGQAGNPSQPALKTSDGGDSWEVAFNDKYFNRIRFVNDSVAYGTGDYLYKLKRTKLF